MGMTISGSSGVTFPDSTTMTSGNQACKAWVNFNGTGTVAIRASFNVTSITDITVGAYRINMSTALPDANYVVSGTGYQNLRTDDASFPRTSSTFQIIHAPYYGAAHTDPDNCNVSVHR